jgi:hypothetical protein
MESPQGKVIHFGSRRHIRSFLLSCTGMNNVACNETNECCSCANFATEFAGKQSAYNAQLIVPEGERAFQAFESIP